MSTIHRFKLNRYVIYNVATCVCSLGTRGTICANSCSASEVPSYDGTFCMACPNGTATVTLSAITSTTRQVCICPSGSYVGLSTINSADQPYNISLTSLKIGVCTPCLMGFYPSTDLSGCISCPDPVTMVAVASVSGSLYTYSCQCRAIYSAVCPELTAAGRHLS